jgi:hypothetical protein
VEIIQKNERWPIMTSSIFGEVISSYSLEEAIEDGLLVKVGEFSNKHLPILFTSSLFEEVKESYPSIIRKGADLLRLSNKEDSPNMRLRIIEKGKIWVIQNSEGCTFMKPEDY